jgi:hypothetical protein
MAPADTINAKVMSKSNFGGFPAMRDIAPVGVSRRKKAASACTTSNGKHRVA